MRLDGGLECAEAKGSVVVGTAGGGGVWVRDDGDEDGHGAAEDVDEGVGDNELDDLVQQLALVLSPNPPSPSICKSSLDPQVLLAPHPRIHSPS